jgi:hypothetical protein
MTIWPGYRLRLSLGRPRAAPVRRRVWLAAAAAAAVIGLVVAPAIPVAPPPVKSVTISIGSTTYINCVYGSSTGTQLGFPNGACVAFNGIQVTNGTAPATIMVNGADMVPADNGTHWALEPASPLTYDITSPPPLPGPDQYLETVSGLPLTGGYNSGPQLDQGPFLTLTNTPSCDLAFTGFTGCGTVPAGTANNEFLAMTGPSSSTDTSSTFTTTVTWTAT